MSKRPCGCSTSSPRRAARRCCQRLLPVVSGAAGRLGRPTAIGQGLERPQAGPAKQQITDIDLEQKARTTLQDSPEDPAANTTLGRILCCNYGSWEEGLKCLAASGNEAFKKLAEQDLANPRDSRRANAIDRGVAQGVSIGDRSGDQGGFPMPGQNLVQTGSRQSGGRGPRPDLEKRLAELSPGSGCLKGEYFKVAAPKGIYELQTPPLKTRIDRQLDFDWKLGSPRSDRAGGFVWRALDRLPGCAEIGLVSPVG